MPGFDLEHFEALAMRLRIRVTKHSFMAVGGSAGHVVYMEDPGLCDFRRVEEVERALELFPFATEAEIAALADTEDDG